MSNPTDTNQASEVKRNSLNKSDIDVKLESYGQDIFSYKSDSIGAEDYQALAKEVIAMEGN